MQSHPLHQPGGVLSWVEMRIRTDAPKRGETIRSAVIRRRLLLQSLGLWVLFLGFAVINGLFRETVLEPNLGPEPAHFLSTTTLAGFVFFVTLLFVGLRSEVPAKTELLGVGILWAALTALLELCLGLVRGLPVALLFCDYDVSRGRLFGLVILATLLSPPLAGFLRRLRR
jgi:hypothetical protein